MARSLARLALEAAAEPPAGADVHADPPVEAPKHGECPSNAQVARGGGVAGVQDPRAHEHRYVDTRAVRRSSVVLAGRVRARAVNEKNGVVVGGV